MMSDYATGERIKKLVDWEAFGFRLSLIHISVGASQKGTGKGEKGFGKVRKAIALFRQSGEPE